MSKVTVQFVEMVRIAYARRLERREATPASTEEAFPWCAGCEGLRQHLLKGTTAEIEQTCRECDSKRKFKRSEEQ